MMTKHRISHAGKWERPTIDNPEYVEDSDLYLHPDNSYIGLDLWQVKSGSIFDNIIITDSLSEAREFAKVCEHALYVDYVCVCIYIYK